MKSVLLMCLIGALTALAFFIGFVLLVKYLLPKDQDHEEN